MADYLDSIADISVDRTSAPLTRPGFGTLLLLAYHGLYADRVRSYSDLAAMVADGFTPYDKVYRDAQAAWSQTPAPPSIKVGRRALPFTQVVNVTPSAPVSGSAAETWSLKIDGHTVTFTSDATPTLAEVCTGLAAAVNALADVDAIVATGASSGSIQTLTGATLDGAIGDDVMVEPRFVTLVLSAHANWDATSATLAGIDGNGNAVTESLAIPDGGDATVTSTRRYLRVTSITIPAQSGTSGTFTVGLRAIVTASGVSGTTVACTSVAGELHSYELTTRNFAGLTTATTNAGIATDLAAVLAADGDWYGLVLDSNGSAEVVAAAAWVETNKKLMLAQSSDEAHLSTGSTTCMGYQLKNANYLRTAWVFRRKIGTLDACTPAAWTGKEFAKDPGASAWGHKTLAGQTADELTNTERAAIESYNGNHYASLGGRAVANPGKVAGNEWLDVTRDLDSVRVNLQYDLVDLELANDKIPMTDGGIGLVRTQVEKRMTLSVDAGIFAAGPTVTAPLAAAVSSTNRQNRILPSVTFQARVAGSIHKIQVRGRVSA